MSSYERLDSTRYSFDAFVARLFYDAFAYELVILLFVLRTIHLTRTNH